MKKKYFIRQTLLPFVGVIGNGYNGKDISVRKSDINLWPENKKKGQQKERKSHEMKHKQQTHQNFTLGAFDTTFIGESIEAADFEFNNASFEEMKLAS